MLIKLDAMTILIYTVVIIAILFAVFCEVKDIKCSNFDNKQCGVGMGRAYAQGKPEHGDSKRTLLEKASITARYEVNSIFWRRSFIAAVVSAFLVLFVMKSKCPNGIQFASAVLIIYIIFYLTFTMFQKWITDPALNQMNDILAALKAKT